MHGDIDRPDEAVVTKDDYEKYSRDREPFITALAGDLVKKTFLFLGFSFRPRSRLRAIALLPFTSLQNMAMAAGDHLNRPVAFAP
jgi:hypothetical protein